MRERPQPDVLDRWHAQVAIDDGSGKQLSVLVGLSTAADGPPVVNEERVAELIEQMATQLPAEDRLKELLYATADGPGILLDVWCPDDYRSIFKAGTDD